MKRMQQQLPSGSFFGRAQRKYRVGDAALVECLYNPGLHIPVHEHSRAYFFLVLEGTCTETDERGTRCAGPEALGFQPAGSSHADFWQGGGRCFSFEVPPAKLALAGTYTPMLRHPFEVTTGEPVRIARRLYGEFQRIDEVSPLVVEGLILELLAEAARSQHREAGTKPPTWLRRVQDIARHCFTDRPRLADIAAEVGIHPVHLCREFRKHCGCTFGEYVRELRLAFASEQLRNTRKSLTDVALSAGFSDQSHLTRSFRRYSGLTPLQFRRQAQSR